VRDIVPVPAIHFRGLRSSRERHWLAELITYKIDSGQSQRQVLEASVSALTLRYVSGHAPAHGAASQAATRANLAARRDPHDGYRGGRHIRRRAGRAA
jgi:hypothetical protein